MNLQKKFIWPSTLLAEYNMHFAPKKDNPNGRLYINYKKLNEITIKNAYFILRIEELQIWL